MSKKIICLLLSLVFLLGALAGCGKKTDEEAIDNVVDQASESTVTLAMYLMSEEKVSDEQKASIEAAVNRITKAKFKAQLKLYFYTEDEYYEKLEAALARKDEAVANGEYTTKVPATTGDETTEEETIINEYGLTELKYPTIPDYQVDIFYFSGYDRYLSYNDKSWLSRVDEELSSASKALKTTIAPAYLEQLKAFSSGTYAIPTNKPIGEYTYLLLNKEVLSLTQYSVDDGFTSLTDTKCQDILSLIAKTPEYREKFVPLHSFTGELDIANMQYWGVDENGILSNHFSVLGGYADPSKVYLQQDAYAGAEHIFASRTNFVSPLKILAEYEVKGYYGNTDEADKDFAIGYVKGGAELAELYGDKYELVPVQMPVLNTVDLFQDMFGVANYTSDLSRSMEIVTYLNTNADFRNLILYGIEGVNYEMVETDLKDVNGDSYQLVRRLNNSYMMDVNKTGNTLIATPLEGENPLIREYGKIQNRDSKISLSMGFTLDYADYLVDPDALAAMRTLSGEIFAELKELPAKIAEEWENNIDGTVTLEAFISTKVDEYCRAATEKIVSSDAFKTLSSMSEPAESEETPVKCAFKFLYYKWLEDKKIYKPEEEMA